MESGNFALQTRPIEREFYPRTAKIFERQGRQFRIDYDPPEWVLPNNRMSANQLVKEHVL